MAVKFIIDSASDMSEQNAHEIGVTLIPMQILINGEEYYDGVTLTPEDFFDKLEQSKEFPQTSLINQYRWEEKFKELTKDGDEVVAIVLSSKLSGTYNAAVEASKNFEEKVFVVDSLSAALGERLLLQYGMELAKLGKTAKEIKEELDEKRHNVKLVAIINTLKYLKKGGRISATTAFVGEILSIKPAVSLINGEVKMIGKVKGLKKGNRYLNEKINELGGINFNMPYGLLYSGNDDTNLQNYVQDSKQVWEHATNHMPIYKLGSTIGTHIGPGAYGIAFFEN